MGNDVVTREKKRATISLRSSLDEVDISTLPPETQAELQKYATMKKIDLQATKEKTQIDLDATSAAVGNMAGATQRATASGDSVTIRQTIENAAGKTEVLMGNATEAKRGNVDRGENTWMFVVGGIAILLIVATALGS